MQVITEVLAVVLIVVMLCSAVSIISLYQTAYRLKEGVTSSTCRYSCSSKFAAVL